VTGLPGGLPVDELADALRRWTHRPGLVVDDVRCAPVRHRISAPTTRALTRVTVAASDADGPVTLSLVTKELQAARYGLPPQMPDEARAHLDTVIPWRLEADVYASPVADRMPDGLRMPDLVTVHEEPGDRMTLWLEDVDPVDTPWTDADHARAAGLLGRLAARRAGDDRMLPLGGEFLTSYLRDNLLGWSGPLLRSDDLWQHPLFRLPAVADLREDLTALSSRVDALFARLDALPEVLCHGDATPMNLLRPRSRPTDLVAVDWGTATPAPVGFDVVPLVFGRAEAGTGPATEVPGLLDIAVPAYRDGLAAEGTDVPLETVRTAVVLAALLRYPSSSLPLEAFLGGAPVTDESIARTLQRAAFVRMVLDLERDLPR
jgi:hypothetical protein